MNYTYLPDVVSFFLLCWTFILLLRQRKQFQSLTPVLIATVFLSFGRIADVILEFSISRYASTPLGWKRESFDLIMTNTGNICDVLGILFLIYGFLKTIEFQKKEKSGFKIWRPYFRFVHGAKNIVQKMVSGNPLKNISTIAEHPR